MIEAEQIGKASRRLLDMARDTEDPSLRAEARTYIERCAEWEALPPEMRELRSDEEARLSTALRHLTARLEERLATKPAASRRGQVVFRCEDLGKVRRSTPPEFKLAGLALELRLGELTAVIAPNGHGKTTLLELVAGRLKHDEGLLHHYDPARPGSPIDDWSLVKRHTGYIAQDLLKRNLQGTLDTNLRFVAALYGATGERNDREVNDVCGRLGIEKYRYAGFKELSGGFKTRYALAEVILKRPRLLVLDEPLAHLDKNSQVDFLDDIRNLARSESTLMAVLLSSQHLHEIEAISDRTLFLSNGQVGYYGETQELGSDRKFNFYEIGCPQASLSSMRAALDRLALGVTDIGPAFIVKTDRSTSLQEVMNKLFAERFAPTYIRDIGGSTRLMMAEHAGR